MATLNKRETDILRSTEALLDGILKDGYDPNDIETTNKRAQIVGAKKGINTIVTIKGHFPK